MQIGTANPDALAENAPRLSSLDVEAVTLEGLELFQLLCEVKADGLLEALPPALHPTIPGVLTWLAYRFDESPWGPFRLAQTRIECRSGTRPRGLFVAGVIDNEAASHALAGGWGYNLRMGEIDLRRGFDGVDLRVSVEGECILDLAMHDPLLLPPDSLQFVSSLHPAHTPAGFRLVQVDPVHHINRAERGEPIVNLFDAEAWAVPGLEPQYPISAACGSGSLTLGKLRFLCRPGELAFTGTETV
jgi:hypothetical protein